MSQNTTLEAIARHLGAALVPLREATADLESFQRFMLRLGWSVGDLPAPYVELAGRAGALDAALDGLGDPATLAQIAAVLDGIRALAEAIRAVQVAPAGVDAAAFLAELGERLVEVLLVDYLYEELPFLARLLEAVEVITSTAHASTAARPGFVETRFRFGEIPRVIADPGSLPARVYGFGTPDFDFERVAGHLQELFLALDWLVGMRKADLARVAGYQGTRETRAKRIASELVISVAEVDDPSEPQLVGLSLLELPAEGTQLPGMILQPAIPPSVGAGVQLTPELRLDIRAGSDLARTFGVFVRPGEVGVRYPFQPGTVPPSAGFGADLSFAPPAPVMLLGTRGATRLEALGARGGIGVDIAGTDVEMEVSLDLQGLSIVLAAGDADGFLATLFGHADLRIPVPLGLRWSSKTGLTFRGSAGFDVTVSPHLRAGPIAIDTGRLALSARVDPGQAPALEALAQVAIRGALGPVSFTTEGVGYSVRYTAASGNAGPFAVDAGFRAPSSVGLSIDSALVSGGGFLGRDAAIDRYLGAVSLRIGQLQAGGAGVLDTRLPDGSRGYSLAAIASARFPRMQLGWGFTLDGLGAFLGVHRTADVEALRAGLRDGALARLFGAADPVTEAPAIVAALARYFPPRRGRFLIGPAARLGWGTPAVLQADLALLLELPAPIRILALAAVQVGLPTLEHRIVDLRMDVLGVLDLGRKLLAVDASLHHSSLAGYPLTGDMALRTGWGDDPHFLLAIGGFHPEFHPPPGFPSLGRVALAIGNNPQLRLEAYLALTSSTVQLGARAELSYRASGLSIGGHLQFHALIDLRPFHLEAELEAKVSISYRGHDIASAKLAFLLSGPRPWRARGTATIGILWWDVSVGFDVTWGDRTPPALPPPPDVGQLLRNALLDRTAWAAELPAGERGWLVLRDAPPDGPIRVHPLAALVVRQRAVPLGLQITAFHTAPLPAARRFAIQGVRVGGAGTDTEPVQDTFAPAQFARLSADERLAAPSFEALTSGVRVRAAPKLGPTARAAMDHDTVVHDPMAPPQHPRPAKVSAALLEAASALRAETAPRRPAPGRVHLRPRGFALVSARTLSIDATGARIAAGQTTYAALREALRAATDDRGAPVTGLQIVPRAEAANHGVRVVVVREDERLRNIDFVDTVTGAAMTREDFVREIRAGHYPAYEVRRIRGLDTPVSKPTPTTEDNLG